MPEALGFYPFLTDGWIELLDRRGKSILARRARVAGDRVPKGSQRSTGRSRWEQAPLGHDGFHQGKAAPAHRRQDREAVYHPTRGPLATRGNTAADRNEGIPRDSTLTDW